VEVSARLVAHRPRVRGGRGGRKSLPFKQPM
jgi:hypothetical protein